MLRVNLGTCRNSDGTSLYGYHISTFYTIGLNEAISATHSYCLIMWNQQFIDAIGLDSWYQFAGVKAYNDESAAIVLLANKSDGAKSVLVLFSTDFSSLDLNMSEITMTDDTIQEVVSVQ